MPTEKDRQVRRHRKFLRDTGRGLTVSGPELERLIRKIRSFRARGMSYAEMYRQTGLNDRSIAHVARNNPKYVTRTNYNILVAMRFEEPDGGGAVSSVGTVRRLGALWMDGFPVSDLADMVEVGNKHHFGQLIMGKSGATTVLYATHRSVAELYDRLDGKKPEDAGVHPISSKQATAWAKKRGVAPRHAWDPDTIDDPEAFPEWTGECGNVRGWLIHKREDIPMCNRCRGLAHAPRTGVGDNVDFDGEKLRRIRQRRGIELSDLAKRVGIDKSTIMYWELGRMKPSHRTNKLELVLRELDATPADVMEDP